MVQPVLSRHLSLSPSSPQEPLSFSKSVKIFLGEVGGVGFYSVSHETRRRIFKTGRGVRRFLIYHVGQGVRFDGRGGDCGSSFLYIGFLGGEPELLITCVGHEATSSLFAS